MKKLIIYALIVLIVVVTSSCIISSNKKTNDSKKAIEEVDNQQKTNDKSSATQQNSNKEKEFFGNWQVKRIVAYSKIYSEEESQGIIGNKFSYTSNLAKSETGTCENPTYNITKLSRGDFEDGFRVNLDDFDINEDKITQVNITTKNGSDWDYTGGLFFIKDQDTLILPVGGVFFEMKREK